MSDAPSKQKTSRRKATPEQLADLKAAKKRGLHTLDLRKPLTSYGRKLAASFKGLAAGRAAVVTVTEDDKKAKRDALKYYKERGYTVRGDKVIVQKPHKEDTVRYSKKSHEIIRTSGAPGERESTPVVFDLKRVPRLKKNQRYKVVFANNFGIYEKFFVTKRSLGQFMSGYGDPGTSPYYDYFLTIENS